MIVKGMSDAAYLRIHMLPIAERRRIKRRVNMLIRSECGVGFSLVIDCSLSKRKAIVAPR